MKHSLLLTAFTLYIGMAFINAQKTTTSYRAEQAVAFTLNKQSITLYGESRETPYDVRGVQERTLQSYAPVNLNGKIVLFASYDSYVQGWDVASGTLIYKDSIAYNEATSNEWGVVVRVAGSKNFLLADYSGDSRLLKVIDLQNFTLYDTLTGYVKYSMSHTDKLVAMMETEESFPVQVVDFKTRARHVLATDNDWSNVLKISPSGNYVVRIKRDSILEIYDTRSLALLAKTHVPNRKSTLVDVHFTADEQVFLVEGEKERELSLFSTQTGKQVKTFRQPIKPIMMWPAMKFVVFDNKGKGAYVTIGNELHYYELNGNTPPKLIKVAGVPNQYEEDGSFWLRNRKASELVHYSANPGGIVKQLAKHKYAKGYDPYKVTGSYAFLEGASELIVLAKDAKRGLQPHYAIYSYSPHEANVKRASVK